MKFKLNAFYNMDCMEALRNIEDKYFDLAIVDPPYFSGPERREFFGRSVSPIGVQRLYRESEKWSVPTTEYFDELFRVSKNQIIWGCNYFDYQFGPGRIVWDKCNGTSSFSDAEIAYCSMHDSAGTYIDKQFEKKLKEYEKYWQKCIVISAGSRLWDDYES